MGEGNNEGFKFKNSNWQSPQKPFSFDSTQEKDIPNVYDVCIKSDKKKKLTQDEITNLKMELEKAKYKMNHDPLTGCYNKNFLNDFLEKFDPDEDANTSVIFCDINDLRNTNKKEGHTAGDQRIINTVSFIKENVREKDLIIRGEKSDEIIIICKVDIGERTKFEETIKNRFNKQSDFAFGTAHFNNTIDNGSIKNTINSADKFMSKQKNEMKSGIKKP